MKIGFIQFKPVFGEVEANVETMKRLISSVEADLLVLPELATTGYTFTSPEELAKIAEPFDNSHSLDSLQDLARERSCALVVGFGESAGKALYNSAAFLKPDGSRHLYRKVHLFGAENLFFKPGDIPFNIHDLNGVTIGMMICFDWFFPESMRVLALKGAQIICHPVNFILPWGQRAMVIRSLENRVFVVTANRYGTETRGEYSFTFTGESQITSPGGDVLTKATESGDAVSIIDIDPSAAADKHLNRYNDLFEMRRPEFYGEITG
ncbi:nitrilase-related carbon-nitrogen hydrolase [Candidatus Latescibacterota bacterium]